MTTAQKNYFMLYLHSLEERIESKRSELKAYASYTGISTGSIASIASELTALIAEQRAICFTLRNLGYYVQFKDNHAVDILCEYDQESAGGEPSLPLDSSSEPDLRFTN